MNAVIPKKKRFFCYTPTGLVGTSGSGERRCHRACNQGTRRASVVAPGYYHHHPRIVSFLTHIILSTLNNITHPRTSRQPRISTVDKCEYYCVIYRTGSCIFSLFISLLSPTAPMRIYEKVSKNAAFFLRLCRVEFFPRAGFISSGAWPWAARRRRRRPRPRQQLCHRSPGTPE